MILQQELIERVRALCLADDRLDAALIVGSFTLGEGDAYSDIEFVFFFGDEHLARLDRRAWIEQIAPVLLFFPDDNGHYTAIFRSLVRGEFHFRPASAIATIATWHGSAWFPTMESTVILDRNGAATAYLQPLLGAPPERETAERIESLCANFLNWVLFGVNVLHRGEHARALEILSIIQRYLIWLARLDERATHHWPTPSRLLERDISPTAYERLKTCAARLDSAELARAYAEALAWGVEMLRRLGARHSLTLPDELIERLERRISV